VLASSTAYDDAISPAALATALPKPHRSATVPFVLHAVATVGALPPDTVLRRILRWRPPSGGTITFYRALAAVLYAGFVRQARGQIPIAEPANRGSVQQGFYDAFKIGASPAFIEDRRRNLIIVRRGKYGVGKPYY
jgi:hypothetical protein